MSTAHLSTQNPVRSDWATPEHLLAAAGIGFELVHVGKGHSCDDCPGTLERAA